MGMVGWASQGRDDILCGGGGGGWGGGCRLVVAPSCCLHQLSVPLFSKHITTPTNKPCHLETPALVTMLSSSTTGATHKHSLIGPKTQMYCIHTHTFSTIFPLHCVALRHRTHTLGPSCAYGADAHNLWPTVKPTQPVHTKSFHWAICDLSLCASHCRALLRVHMLSFTSKTTSLICWANLDGILGRPFNTRQLSKMVPGKIMPLIMNVYKKNKDETTTIIRFSHLVIQKII